MIRKAPDDSRDLIAAYREGLGLAAVIVTGSPANLRIKIAESDEDSDGAQARWWCRRAAEAECVAAAAARQLRRESKKPAAGVAAAAGADSQAAELEPLSLAQAAVLAAAKKFNIAVQSDREIADEAAAVIARIEAEMREQQACGGLKAVNRAYRGYRLDSAARGERVESYDDWMRKYRRKLVRQVAAALRQI